jgi:hypothetical protein
VLPEEYVARERATPTGEESKRGSARLAGRLDAEPLSKTHPRRQGVYNGARSIKAAAR